jgi:2-isopropylmalate synthase
MIESNPAQVEIFETSLRDGMQQPNIEISLANAVSLLQRMSDFGVHYAEIGFAGANKFVADLTEQLESIDSGRMKLALFGRTRGRGTSVTQWPDVQFILARRRHIPVAVLVVKSRLLDVFNSLETTPEENLLMTYETVACLQDHGMEVLLDFEHAMDANCGRRENGNLCDPDFNQRSLDYFHKLTRQSADQGVSRIVICDTTGGANPEEVTSVFKSLRQTYPGVSFGFHGHNDRGLGIANSRAAILAGAVQVQGTLIGTGERCGNVNLTTVVGGMQLRGEARFVTDKALTGLTSLSRSACTAFSLEVPHGFPIMGTGAFGTWAGMHGSSERKNPGAYLWCDPTRVGVNPVIGVNSQSGKANIILLSETLGVPLSSAQAQEFGEVNHAMIEGGGFTASEVSFRLACMKILKTLPDTFSIKSWRVIDESDEARNRYIQASMLLSIGNSVVTTRAEGAGPIDSLTKALRQELEKWYPDVANVHLGRFSVNALDVIVHDTAARVRVTVSFSAEGHHPWTTAGVSGDLNQAALMAIIDGYRHWLINVRSQSESIALQHSLAI